MEAQKINYDYDVSVACLLARRVVQDVLEPWLYSMFCIQNLL